MLKIFRQYYPVRNILFVLGEGIAVFNSVLIASFLLLGIDIFNDPLLYIKALLITVVCQICLYYNDLYNLKVTSTYTELGIRLFQALGVASIFLAGIYLLFSEAIIGEGIFVVSVGFVIIFIVTWRMFYFVILKLGIFDERIILIGSGELAEEIVTEIKDKMDCGYKIFARVVQPNDSVDFSDKKNEGIIYKHKYDGLCELATENNIKKIIVALKQKRGAFPTNELLRCRVEGIEILKGNDFYELLTGKLFVDQINPAWLIYSDGFRKTRTRRVAKRCIDIILSLVMLIVLIPVMILTAIIIKIESKGPVLFSQERVGERRRAFMIHKFRSMVADAEKLSGPVWATEKDNRITRVGGVIRKLRIDELPQLWNVLKGEMSFVGPRPERDFFVKQLEAKIPYYGERFTVKPGLTGWAQVSYGYGANAEDALEKLNYELFYTKNFSIFMDLMIVLRTVKTVIFGKGR